MGKYCKNNITIWSHCLSLSLPISALPFLSLSLCQVPTVVVVVVIVVSFYSKVSIHTSTYDSNIIQQSEEMLTDDAKT